MEWFVLLVLSEEKVKTEEKVNKIVFCPAQNQTTVAHFVELKYTELQKKKF